MPKDKRMPADGVETINTIQPVPVQPPGLKTGVPHVFVIIIAVFCLSLGSIVGYSIGSREFTGSGKTQCTLEAKMCPDGTAVGRVGPKCEFAPCPGEPNGGGGVMPMEPEQEFAGDITAVRSDESSVTFQLNAESWNGEVTDMRVWTDKKENDEWVPYKQFTTVDKSTVDEFVYVQFMDSEGNVSDVYSGTIFTEESPADSRNL